MINNRAIDIQELNRKEYHVNLHYLRKLLRNTYEEGVELMKELNQVVKEYGNTIDTKNTRDVINFINKTILQRDKIKKPTINNSDLEGLYTETRNEFVGLLIQYRKLRDKYNRIAVFIKQAIDEYFDKSNSACVKGFLEDKADWATIRPHFRINQTGNISMIQPSMHFSAEEIMRLLGFNVAIKKEGIGELLKVWEKYSDITWTVDSEPYLLILGKIMYLDIIIDERYIIPFSFDEDEEPVIRGLIKEFHREYQDNRSGKRNVFIIK